jgi:FkbM family methyltransferase
MIGRTAEVLRRWLPTLHRRLPVAGSAGLLDRLNQALLRSGATPTAETRMRGGHRLRLDLRSPAQARAFYTGEFDDDRIRMAQDLMTGGSIAIDAGANVGLWTVPLAGRAAAVGARVIAVEPVPSNAARLRHNLAINDVTLVADVVQTALSDVQGSGHITLREDFDAGAATGNAALTIDDGTDERFTTIAVPLVPLDDLLGRYGAPHVSVVKADLEGHEDRFLAGASDTFARCRPTAFFEWNLTYYRRRGVDPAATVRPLLRQLRYHCLRDRGRGDWREQPDFWSPRDIDDLVLVPDEDVTAVQTLLTRR